MRYVWRTGRKLLVGSQRGTALATHAVIHACGALFENAFATLDYLVQHVLLKLFFGVVVTN